jgi:diaminohydroxyphosphoribosylaminopyrimidine deaminase/5-amino-6-(5-phosphoribosylamino)uracil reductase
MYSTQDHTYMSLALAEAKKSLFISNPNPRVGCVLVKNNEIIGLGHTQAAGSDHAEVQALKDAQKKGADVTGATAYVTLEPCCHHGKTPPCTDSLIKAKVAKVIAAMEDPNPLIAGQGLEVLRQAGIDVRCGLLEKEATELNIGFIHRMKTGLPWVRMKIAASLDGTTALNNGVSQWITNSDARHDGHHWRARACCVLTGIGTVKEDNPQMNVRDIDTPRQPLRVLIDSFLGVPLNSKILDESIGGHTIIFCGAVEPTHFNQIEKELRTKNVSIVQLPDRSNDKGKVDLQAVIKHLAEKLHINEVHVEAGFKLNGSLLRENCVNELLLYMAPKLLGPGFGLANLPALTNLNQTTSWQFIDHELVGDDLRLRLYVSSQDITKKAH